MRHAKMQGNTGHSQDRKLVGVSGRIDMFTTSFKSPRRFAGYVLTLLLSSVCLCATVSAQVPSVVSSSAVAVPHNESYGAPWQNAVSNRGDFVLFDFKRS